MTIPTSSSTTGTGVARLLDACHRRPSDATPVWFMRQAGRALPAYRALKERYSVLEMARTPEVAAAVTLMPVRELGVDARSEEHTSELQSPCNLVCRLLLEKKKKQLPRIIQQT